MKECREAYFQINGTKNEDQNQESDHDDAIKDGPEATGRSNIAPNILQKLRDEDGYMGLLRQSQRDVRGDTSGSDSESEGGYISFEDQGFNDNRRMLELPKEGAERSVLEGWVVLIFKPCKTEIHGRGLIIIMKLTIFPLATIIA